MSKCTIGQIDAKHLKKGHYAILKQKPCRVLDISIHKQGKHGSTKASIKGIDLMLHKKVELAVPGESRVTTFVPIKFTGKLLEIVGNNMRCVTEGKPFDVKFNEKIELHEEIKDSLDNGVINLTLIKVPVEQSDEEYLDYDVVDSYSASEF